MAITSAGAGSGLQLESVISASVEAKKAQLEVQNLETKKEAESVGAKLDGQKLVLDGVLPTATLFTSRPKRSVGHMVTPDMADIWRTGSFAKDPPNATVSVLNKGKGEVVDAVMVLKSPKLEGDKLVFNVEVIEGNLAGGDGAVSVFLDIINLPLARRTSHRSAWYAGAQ